MSREDAQMKIRLPESLRDQIVSSAEANKRTLNAEIVHRLQFSFSSPDAPLTPKEKDELREIVLAGITRTLLEAPEYAEFVKRKAETEGEGAIPG